MQSLITGLLVGLSLLLFTGTSYGQDSLLHASVDQLIEEYGIRESVDNMTGTISSQFQSNPLGLAPNIHEQVMDDMDRRFHTDSLMKSIRSKMIDQYQQEKLTRALDWLESDLAQQINRLEDQMSTIEGYRLRIVRWYEMDQDPPSVVRITIIDEMNDATGTIEMVVDTFSGFFRGYLNRASAYDTEQSFSEADISRFVDNYRARVRNDIQGQLREQQLVTYAELSDEKLNEYVDFYESETGSWLTEAVMSSVEHAINEAASQISDS